MAQLEVSGTNTDQNESINLKLGGDYKITKGLVLKGDLSYRSIANRSKDFKAEYDFYDPNDETLILQRWYPSELNDSRWSSSEINAKALLVYDKVVGDHTFSALGGVDVTENKGYYLEGSRKNIYSNEYDELNTGDADTKSNVGYSEDWSLYSFLGRINYNYKGKYLLEANARYDGSSRFAKGNKWGVFPSFSAGWRMSEEGFMGTVDFLDNLKLRASWGQLGNQNIGLYKFSSTVYSTYAYNFNDKEVSGYSQYYFANTDITWETTEMLDFGVDVTLFGGKLGLVADYFVKDTKDVLLILPNSYLTGLAASEINAGKVRNKGYEFTLSHNNKINDFKYTVSLLFSDVKNELVDFSGKEPVIDGWTIKKEGEALDAFFGYKSDGLFQSTSEIDNHAVQPNHSSLKPGDIKLVDLNGDQVIDDEDRTVIGSAFPRYNTSMSLYASYKGFDMNAFFQGVLKAENYFYGAPNEGPSYEIFTTTRTLDRWTPENTGGSYPRLEAASNKNNYLYSDFWIRDASYVRLKNLQIGYSFDEPVLNKLKVDKLRLYVGGTNLFTITDVESGIDPETFDGRPSYYPPVSLYTFGIQLTF